MNESAWILELTPDGHEGIDSFFWMHNWSD